MYPPVCFEIRNRRIEMLFGRKKPGFVQVVTTGVEAENAAETIETAETAKNEKEENLLDYLTSLPDAEDPFEGLAAGEGAGSGKGAAAGDAMGSGQPEAAKEPTRTQKLAEYIRLRSAAAHLTPYQALLAEDPEVDSLLAQMSTEEGCGDIALAKGEKDVYYYSSENMSANYAMIAVLADEKDLVRTMAQMARWNCKTYPVPTPLTYFEQHPYFATKPQIDRAAMLLGQKEEYSDVKLIHNSLGRGYLFSTEYMSEKYARALAEPDEYVD